MYEVFYALREAALKHFPGTFTTPLLALYGHCLYRYLQSKDRIFSEKPPMLLSSR